MTLEKINLFDPYRHNKNKYGISAEYIFDPKRLTSNPSRIDYILVSKKIINRAEQLGPRANINSDHDYLELNIYTHKSRSDRRNFADF